MDLHRSDDVEQQTNDRRATQTRTVRGAGYEVMEFETTLGCRVQSDATKNSATGLWDEAIVLSCPTPLELGLPKAVMAVRRRRRGSL